MGTYTVEINSENRDKAFAAVVSEWGRLEVNGYYRNGCLQFMAHSAHYESPEHFAFALQAVLDKNEVSATVNVV